MQFLSIVVALVTLGFALNLSKSRRGDGRYGIVLVLLPLALAIPLSGILASGLLLIYAYRNAASTEGREALVVAINQAADAQYVGHLTLIAVLVALALIALMLLRPATTEAKEAETEKDDDDTPRALSRYAIPLMIGAVAVCIVAVATLSVYQDRFIESPLAFVTAFDERAVGEFSTSRREVEEQQRMGSNTLVVETFRTLVVVILFLVLFDAFLVASRTVTFTKATVLVSITLILLAAGVSTRKAQQQRALMVTIEERLVAAAKAHADSPIQDKDDEETITTPGVEVVPPPPR